MIDPLLPEELTVDPGVLICQGHGAFEVAIAETKFLCEP
jgi:hypothetical protein